MTPTGTLGGLPVGQVAPDFTLRDQFGQDVTLSQFRGQKSVLLVFYPFAFSGVCTSEMFQIRSRLAELMTFGSEVLAISCDPIYALRNFADSDGLNFPLLSDFWPHGEVAKAYQVFDLESGAPRRSSFAIDLNGVISWSVHNPGGTARDVDEHIRELRAAAEDT